MDSTGIIKILRADGWKLKSITGSHYHFTHPIKAGKVTVPHPRKDLPKGTYNSILKQAGLK
jgi:predicted RNA binding protein YcfA (HicA-like mRNA interferase family)